MAKNKNRNRIDNNKQVRINNSVLGDTFGVSHYCQDNQLYNPKALFYNSSPLLITMLWTELTYAYKSNSYIQNAINQIVDDAFRNEGLLIDSETLSTEELSKLRQYIYDFDIEEIKDAIRWGELYGGGVLIANTEQNPEYPLNERQLYKSKLEFKASDRWQCSATGNSPYTAKTFLLTDNLQSGSKTGLQVHSSRVGIFTGIKAPYLLRAMLNGWGLSIFESIISPITQYLKAMNVTLELLDEAKIDVFKISGLNELLGSARGQQVIRERLNVATDYKNYKSAIGMDANDDYVQKQITFSGIPEMIIQIQYLVCAALKRPYSKVFGKGSNGFSSGEDDLENYNAIVDSEIRTPATPMIKWAVETRCINLFGRIPPDLKISWKPLRVMSEKDEAEIKSKKLADLLQLFDRQLLTKQQLAQKLTEDNIVCFSEEEINTLDDDFKPDDIDNIDDLIAS